MTVKASALTAGALMAEGGPRADRKPGFPGGALTGAATQPGRRVRLRLQVRTSALRKGRRGSAEAMCLGRCLGSTRTCGGRWHATTLPLRHAASLLLGVESVVPWRLPGISQPARLEQVSDHHRLPGRGCLLQTVAAVQACGSNLDKPSRISLPKETYWCADNRQSRVNGVQCFGPASVIAHPQLFVHGDCSDLHSSSKHCQHQVGCSTNPCWAILYHLVTSNLDFGLSSAPRN